MLNATSAFEPIRLRDITIPNRIWMSPMCQYSASGDGLPTDWHLVHYGSRAVGGVGLVLVESTAVGPRHRSTAADLGLWNKEQAGAHRRLTSFILDAGAVPAVQLQCAGRKSSHQRPWEGKGQNGAVPPAVGGWTPLAPSAIPFGDLSEPCEAMPEDIDEVVAAFARSAALAHEAGYQAVEVHAGHGYLLHQFLSPLSNHRTDEYGGSLENRMRLTLRVAQSVREAFPADKPVLVRVTATDWAPEGITVEEAVPLAKELAALGVDLLDVTSGALQPASPPPTGDGLNVAFGRTLREASGLPVAPVGRISHHALVDDVLARGDADAVLIGRALLRDPYFALRNRDAGKSVWPRSTTGRSRKAAAASCWSWLLANSAPPGTIIAVKGADGKLLLQGWLRTRRSHRRPRPVPVRGRGGLAAATARR
ncbi:NADH:flavin oxidoreductase/NADH oxidase [Micromonospora sp. 4G57]|uniref:NADH:flavin oxidoreductase/NADH oxidase n=1 Tax=Micromonospora sicca TaxID=2202420 RepID=A0ABU5JM09_9ACTN|nr:MULTISPECIES: NADH:flavin oxidoreductase/NADH oxidase [unclassified Micromonospora]MDZ5446980.1 NADH:flavin oxidoreductase/NADH oxidase [Micromonospora sp. 4G57]MDZ5493657.1 NADH:flavin oxidoreductase/NADH oxidase [Micromonospora sp. 4G53]